MHNMHWIAMASSLDQCACMHACMSTTHTETSNQPPDVDAGGETGEQQQHQQHHYRHNHRQHQHRQHQQRRTFSMYMLYSCEYDSCLLDVPPCSVKGVTGVAPALTPPPKAGVRARSQAAGVGVAATLPPPSPTGSGAPISAATFCRARGVGVSDTPPPPPPPPPLSASTARCCCCCSGLVRESPACRLLTTAATGRTVRGQVMVSPEHCVHQQQTYRKSP